MSRRGEDELSLVERGRTLAALRLLGPIAASGRLRSPAARQHLERLCDPAARSDETRALAATVPPGLSAIDPSWYTPPARSGSAAARRYLERVAFGRLVPMTMSAEVAPSPGPSGRALAAVDRLLSGPVQDLEAALLSLGRRRVAVAFTGAPRSAFAQLLARLGEPEANRLVTELRALPPGVSAEEVKGAQRALFRTGAEPQFGESAALFIRRVGASWIAPLVEGHGDRARRLAQRLPRPLGDIILREAAHPISEAERASLARVCAGLPAAAKEL